MAETGASGAIRFARNAVMGRIERAAQSVLSATAEHWTALDRFSYGPNPDIGLSPE